MCDDITAVVDDDGGLERLHRTCPLGDAWFAERLAPPPPAARIDGREADLDAALDEAAAILASARAPLVYGLGRTTCETQRAAVALAEAIGATIDPAGPLLDGASGLASQARGASTATLGDVRDRAEIVVVWSADPVVTHPRLLERLRLPDRGRELVVVDERRTSTAELADAYLELPARPRHRGALDAARARPRGIAARNGARCRRSPTSPRGCAAAATSRSCTTFAGTWRRSALHALVRDLCRVTHAVTVTLRHEANAAGAEDVLAWQTGYPAAVSFANGGPRANPTELSATAVLDRGEADAALVVASDPLEHLPAAAAERLRAIPVVSIDASDTATARAARVAFTTGAPGVHEPGVVHRLDGVPVPFRAVLESTRPSDREVLMAIAGRIARRGGDSHDAAHHRRTRLRPGQRRGRRGPRRLPARRQGRRRPARGRGADRRARHGRHAGRRRHPRPHRRPEGERRAPADARGAPGGRP